ncbi:MAG: crossover junction endodeoxyribonuclease RuvC [Pseudomonadota bacterium]
MVTAAIRILGVDPGLRATGWGVIDLVGSRLVYVGSGAIRPAATDPLASRLADLHQGLRTVVSDFHPVEAAIEETFVNKDPVSTLKLGQARGVALVVPALSNIPVAEYAANKVKKSVVGAGHADKKQVQYMMKLLLPKADVKGADEADALAIAICHAHHRAPTPASEARELIHDR